MRRQRDPSSRVPCRRGFWRCGLWCWAFGWWICDATRLSATTTTLGLRGRHSNIRLDTETLSNPPRPDNAAWCGIELYPEDCW